MSIKRIILCQLKYNKIIFLILLLYHYSSFASDQENIAFNAKYQYHPTTNYKYTTNNNNTTALTDGIFATTHFWKSSETVGWQTTGQIEIEIDLGNNKEFSQVCVSTARGSISGVSFPDDIHIFTSINKKDYKNLGSLYKNKPHPDGDYLTQKFCASELLGIGRYILLIIQPKGQYTFFDEIEVFGKPESTPKQGHQLNKNELLQKSNIAERLLNQNILNNNQSALKLQLQQLHTAYIKYYPDLAPELDNLLKKSEETIFLSDKDIGELEASIFRINGQALLRSSSDPILIRNADPWDTFNPFDLVLTKYLNANELSFNIMRNGKAANAFIITNNTEYSNEYSITLAPSVGTTTPETLFFEVLPIITSSHKIIADALKPLKDHRLILRPGESKQIWITVLANDIEASQYKKTVVIKPLLHSTDLEMSIDLQIKIWPVLFKESLQPFSNAWAYFEKSAIKIIPNMEVTKDLKRNHVNVAVLDPSQIPWPKITKTGSFNIDYSVSDRILKSNKLFTKKLFFFNFNNKSFRNLNNNIEFLTPQWKQLFTEWISAWVSHLKTQGLNINDYAFYPVDEPKNPEEIMYLKEVSKLIKDIEPTLSVYTTLGEIGVTDLISLRDTVDIYQILVKSLGGAQHTTLKSLGKEVWLYTDNGIKDSGPVSVYRSQAWKAFKSNATGIGFWAYADSGWSGGSSWSDFDGKRQDYSVIYETGKQIYSSKRWESWAEGIEDFVLLNQASKAISNIDEQNIFNEQLQKLSDQANFYDIEHARQYLLQLASKYQSP